MHKTLWVFEYHIWLNVVGLLNYDHKEQVVLVVVHYDSMESFGAQIKHLEVPFEL